MPETPCQKCKRERDELRAQVAKLGARVAELGCVLDAEEGARSALPKRKRGESAEAFVARLTEYAVRLDAQISRSVHRDDESRRRADELEAVIASQAGDPRVKDEIDRLMRKEAGS